MTEPNKFEEPAWAKNLHEADKNSGSWSNGSTGDEKGVEGGSDSPIVISDSAPILTPIVSDGTQPTPKCRVTNTIRTRLKQRLLL